jgi:hypothetical protein
LVLPQQQAISGKPEWLVIYQSAHVDYAQFEFIVRSFHTCLDQSATIEELRRILHQHIKELK